MINFFIIITFTHKNKQYNIIKLKTKMVGIIYIQNIPIIYDNAQRYFIFQL